MDSLFAFKQAAMLLIVIVREAVAAFIRLKYSIWGAKICVLKKRRYLCSRNQERFVAQLVEHVTLNHGVVSSILTEPTKGIHLDSLFVLCK